mgnify:FL=1
MKIFDYLKNAYDVVKSFIVTKGFTALVSLGIGVGLWIFGYKIYAGIAFGVFATRNWDILKGFFTKKK